MKPSIRELAGTSGCGTLRNRTLNSLAVPSSGDGWPAALALVVALCALLRCLVGNAVAAPVPDDTQLVCDFLRSPPRAFSFEYVTYTHTTAGGRKIEPYRFQGAWSGEERNWFLPSVVTASNSRDLMDGFAGRDGRVHWCAQRGEVTVYDTGWNGNETSSPLCLEGKAVNASCVVLIRLGFAEIDFARATWNGPQFQGEAKVTGMVSKSWRVSGLVSKIADSEWRISCTNLTTGRLESQTVVRGSRNPEGKFFPQEIDSFLLLTKEAREAYDGVGLVKIKTMHVTKFLPSSTELPEGSLTPLRMPQVKVRGYHFYSNEVLYTFPVKMIPDLLTPGKPVNYGAAYRTLTMDEANELRRRRRR